MASHRIRLAATRGRPRTRLNVEALESRELPSSVIVDTTQFAQDHILVRWLSETPAATPLSTGWTDLGNSTYTVKLASGISVSQAVDYYTKLAGVDFAQPDYAMKVAKTANDTYTSNQWALNAINAPTAWNYTTGNKGIVVAVIDTGVDYTNADLAANAWTNTREIAGNGRDDDGNGYADDVRGWDFANNDAAPMDDNGHGTHVAGIIGAVGNNGTGTTGVAWNVQIMSLKFMGANGSGYMSNAVKAMYYAIDNGAKIINNSWTGGGPDDAMARAITYAQSRGVLVVAAAGNDGTNNDVTPRYPATYAHDNILAVGAVDQNKNLASYSNYGPRTVDIAAPGSSIFSTLPGNQYAYYSGTSMAAPVVSGAAALVWSAHPDWNYRQVIANLLNTAQRLPGLNGKVASGLLDVGKAISSTMPAPTTPTPAPSTPATPVTPSPPVASPGPAVTGVSFLGGTGYFNNARVTFSSAMNAATFDASDVTITGPNGKPIAIQRVSAVAGSKAQFNIYFAPQRTPGNYSVTIGPDVRDTAGRQMDQNRNGVAGEAADRFTVTQAFGTAGAASKASLGEGAVTSSAFAAWSPPQTSREVFAWQAATRKEMANREDSGSSAPARDDSGSMRRAGVTSEESEDLERQLEALFVRL